MTAPIPPNPSRAGLRAARAPRVLVVDDEADLRELLELTLVGMGLDVDSAPDLAQAQQRIGSTRYDLCLTDMRLPDGEGLELVAALGAVQPDTPVAVITAYGSAENAVAALKAGAFDYVAKPVSLDALRALVRSALRVPDPTRPGAAPGSFAPTPPAETGAATLSAEVPWAASVSGSPQPEPPDPARALLIGVSPAIAEVRATIHRLARSMAPVAITGESGAGKELAARLIHDCGSRAGQSFVAVNCGAIPEALMEAEFFGYRKGAFTGADQDRIGFFQAASGGTLFLDEVADLPLAMQVKLLRAIQERKVRRVGASAEEPVDVRIVSATHQNLATCVAQGRFRQDLFYRLNVIELRVPPLRERLEDVPLIARALLDRLAARAGLSAPPKLASVALRYLQSYAFPGNVRELENILERAMAFSSGDVINVEDLGLKPVLADLSENEPATDPSPPPGFGAAGRFPRDRQADPAADQGEAGLEADTGSLAPPGADGVPACLPDYLERLEREAIARALERTGQNRTAAARLLGISFRALRHRMQRLEMQ